MKNPARKKIRPMLSPFVDGELNPQERMRVERHMAACQESADEVADMRALSSLLRMTMEQAAEQEDWAGFPDRVMGQLLPERLPFFQRLRIQLAELFTYQRSWVLAGTSAAVLVVFSLLMWTRPAEPVGYANPHLSIKTVSAQGGAALKTLITHTETGDAVIWVVEESAPEEAQAAPSGEEAGAPAQGFKDTPNHAGAL